MKSNIREKEKKRKRKENDKKRKNTKTKPKTTTTLKQILESQVGNEAREHKDHPERTGQEREFGIPRQQGKEKGDGSERSIWREFGFPKGDQESLMEAVLSP